MNQRRSEKKIHFFQGNYPWIIAALVVTFSLVLGTDFVAKGQSVAVPFFEKITLNRQFKPDPIILRGISGGAIASSGVAGRKETPNGACVGFVDATPDHLITLTEFFQSLSVQVESLGDTTLVVRGPGGSWCNDDYPGRGKNAGIAGEWLAGTYQIWVGSYAETKYYPYRLKISQK